MNTKELSDFYTEHYKVIQKGALVDKLESNDEFMNMNEKKKISFLDFVYIDFLKRDYDSIVDDMYFERINYDLFEEFESKVYSEPTYNLSKLEIRKFVKEHQSELCEHLMNNDYDDFFDMMDKNWIWEECINLTLEDFDNTNLDEFEREKVVLALKEEEYIFINDNKVYSGDYSTYHDFKWDLMNESLEEVISGQFEEQENRIDYASVMAFINEYIAENGIEVNFKTNEIEGLDL